MRTVTHAAFMGAAAVLAAACSSDEPAGPEGPVPVASVTVSPASADVAVGATLALSAVTKDAGGNTLGGRTLDWTSSQPSVATVSASGVVTAVAGGEATITATSEGQAGSAFVTVNEPVAAVTVSPEDPVIGIGTTVTLTAETQVAGGEVVTGREITWSSSNTSVARVNADGTVAAVSTGTAAITATSEGQSGSADLTVFLPFEHIVSGRGASCALDRDGEAYCWGNNFHGEAGVGDFEPHLVPTGVSGGHTFVQLQVGENFACGLDDAGAAWCWGLNVVGQIGNGSSSHLHATPEAVSGGHTFTEIAVGGDHACAITAAGFAWCWGYNIDGQLGDGTTTNSDEPVPVTGGVIFESIGLGGYHSCGLDSAGSAYCWGRGNRGQLGDGTTNHATSGPVAVSGGFTFETIDGGGSHTCAWTSGGAAYCWGNNIVGQLGNGTTANASVPAPVAGGLSFTEGNATGDLSCGTVAPGSTYCWGWNGSGEIGDGTTTDRLEPTQPSGDHAFVTVVAGYQTACALTAEGLAFCWGWNGDGTIGDGTYEYRRTPTMVQPAQL
jgi:alpha-tubulin suppressor-like RCC1 family protein